MLRSIQSSGYIIRTWLAELKRTFGSFQNSNIDRIFAIWQALNNDSYISPMTNPYATFTTAPNTVADKDTRT
jgi:hypothetical protein